MKDKWYFNAIYYQIYPQSFQDSNGDGIGDLQGIINRIDYLKELGVDTIWLNPVYPSPFKDAGYDISDYRNIAKRYGTLKTFDRLVHKLHQNGIRILMDIVFNHTSNEHPWFIRSQKMQKNRYSKWYVWSQKASLVGIPGLPGKWAHWAAERYESYYYQFGYHQPDLNFGFPDIEPEYGNVYDDRNLAALRKELKSVVKFWLDRGVDGFRADVPEVLVQSSKHKGIHPNTSRFWQEVRDTIDSYGDRAFIAEGWSYHVDNIKKSRFNGSFFIPQTCRLLSLAPEYIWNQKSPPRFFSPEGGDITWFIEEYFKLYYNVIKYGGIINMISGCHDMMRMKQVVTTDEIAKCYFAMLLTYPTAPFIYYGDEIGMNYVEQLPSHEGGNFRTGARTPMQWSNKKNAGFSTASPDKCYLPINKDYRIRNVDMQLKNPHSVLNTIKSLIKLRKNSTALGPFAPIRHLYLEKDEKTYIYTRYDSRETWVVALNPSNYPAKITVRLKGYPKEFEQKKVLLPILANGRVSQISFINNQLCFHLPSNTFALYKAN